MHCGQRISKMKLIVSFLLLVCLSRSRQFDANCMIRFYAVQQCQCPCWTFNGTNWDYRADAHRYSEEITTPSRRNFGFKCTVDCIQACYLPVSGARSVVELLFCAYEKYGFGNMTKSS